MTAVVGGSDAESDAANAPFVGPRPFEDTAQDQERFFGRQLETAEVASLILAQQTLLLYAASGAGKSSLMNAAVIPRLRGSGVNVLPVARLQGAREHLSNDEGNPYTRSVIESLGLDLGPTAALNEAMSRCRTQAARTSSLTLLVLDQFEELFTIVTANAWEDRTAFFGQLRDALEDDPRLRIVFVVREDFLANVDPYAPLLQGGLRARFRLRRLSPGPATEAITKPLAAAGLAFEEGVADKLVADLAETVSLDADGVLRSIPGEFVEPVQLQVVCLDLWRRLPRNATKVNAGHVAEAGDVDRALGNHYDRSVASAAQSTGVKEARIRRWVTQSLVTGVGTRNAVIHSGEELGDMAGVVDSLAASHLLRSDHRAGARWVELTHDRLIGPVKTSNADYEQSQRRVWLKRAAIVGGAAAMALIAVGIWLGFQFDSDDSFSASQTASLPSVQLAIDGVATTSDSIGDTTPHTVFVGDSTAVAVNVNVGAIDDPVLYVTFSVDEFEYVADVVGSGATCEEFGDNAQTALRCVLLSDRDAVEVAIELRPLTLREFAFVSAEIEDDQTGEVLAFADSVISILLDTSPLLEDVGTIEFGPLSAPGPLQALIPETWVPVVYVTDAERQCPFVAVREFGAGRVVAIGHDGLLRDDQEVLTGDNLTFALNAVRWVEDVDTGAVAFADTGGTVWVNEASASILTGALRDDGFEVITKTSLLDLSDISVLIIGNSWQYLSAQEYAEIADFVADGGGLILAGLGWSWYELVFPTDAAPTSERLDNVGIPVYTMDVIGIQFGIQWPSDQFIDPRLEIAPPMAALPGAVDKGCSAS